MPIACEQALGEEEGRGGVKERELATMSQEFECRPQYSPRLPAVQFSEFANQRKPETIANVNKDVKGTMLSDTLRKTEILADKICSFSGRVCLPCATKIRKYSEGFNFIRSEMSSHGSSEPCLPQYQRLKKYWTEKMSKTGHSISPAREKEAVQGNR